MAWLMNSSRPVKKGLFNELDFQRTTQAYIGSILIVSMAQWQYAHTNQLGAKNWIPTLLTEEDFFGPHLGITRA
jgi:hypothetical protein